MTLATSQILAPKTIEKAISQLELPGTSLQTLFGWGIGGTNVHLCLRGASVRDEAEVQRGPWVFPVSAKTDAGTKALWAKLMEVAE